MSAVVKLAVVPDDAAELLDLVAPGESVAFQTFAEGSQSRLLNRVHHGTLAEHRQELERMNAAGAGIFWMVNAGDGKGRKAGNITHVRALFVDLDGAPLEPVTGCQLKPHAIVESSPGRWHAYWRVADCGLADFTPAQKVLAAHFHADPKVCDLPRVLRLPGFLHQKHEPFRSHIVSINNVAPYTMTELRAIFGFEPPLPTEDYLKAPTEDYEVSEVSEVAEVMMQCGSGAKLHVDRFVPRGPGERNRCLFNLARHTKARMPDATPAQLAEVVAAWYKLAAARIGTPGMPVSLGDFLRAFDSVRFPEGFAMNRLLKDLDAEPLPANFPADFGRHAAKLMRICCRLQRAAGAEPFYLSSRTAADQIMVHWTDANSMLRAFEAVGLLTRTEKGKGRRASRFRVVQLPEVHA